jgi:predicted RNA-binding Zn-ribbon protein involved in translation (DUF1610 family)
VREIDEGQWRELMDEVMTGMKEWRVANPKARLSEIEQALDERWAKARARMVQDSAMASAAADLAQEKARLGCPACGVMVEVRGQQTRELATYYDQPIQLRRSYVTCPACGTGFFPPG